MKMFNPKVTKKVRVMVIGLEGKKCVGTKSVSLYETNIAEVFEIVEKALKENSGKP